MNRRFVRGKEPRRPRGDDPSAGEERLPVPGLAHVSEAVIYPHIFRNADREVGGVLVGREPSGGGLPQVTGAIPAISADEQLATLTFTQDSWEHVHKVLESDFGDDERIVGWYHSHPGFGIFLSGHDLFIQENFFNSPSQIAVVVDPLGKTDGTFVWREGEITKLYEYPTPNGWVAERNAPDRLVITDDRPVAGEAATRDNSRSKTALGLILGLFVGLLVAVLFFRGGDSDQGDQVGAGPTQREVRAALRAGVEDVEKSGVNVVVAARMSSWDDATRTVVVGKERSAKLPVGGLANYSADTWTASQAVSHLTESENEIAGDAPDSSGNPLAALSPVTKTASVQRVGGPQVVERIGVVPDQLVYFVACSPVIGGSSTPTGTSLPCTAAIANVFAPLARELELPGSTSATQATAPTPTPPTSGQVSQQSQSSGGGPGAPGND